jgi:hypothetical protein
MSMHPDPPNRASLLYNLGLIERSAKIPGRGRDYFEQSLALRPNDEVRKALDSIAERSDAQ